MNDIILKYLQGNASEKEKELLLVWLRADEEKVAIPYETDLNSQKTGEDRDDGTISRSCLLNYRIATAEVVKIQSSNLNGRFIVVKGSHKGGRTGDWETSMELKPY